MYFILSFYLFLLFLNSAIASLTFIFSPFRKAMIKASLNCAVMVRFVRNTLL
jgi:hypothetical protein